MSQPSLQDFSAPFDPTAFPEITQAELLQLITGAVPLAADKGIVVTTLDVAGNPQVPDATANTKWQKYFWRRVGASSLTVYAWNDNAASDPTYQKWQSITLSSIPDGAVTNSKIATSAVTDDKIAAVSWGKLTGIPSSFTPGGAAGGDLTGTYPNPTIGANSVDSTKLKSDAAVDANRAVTTNHIRNNAIDIASKILMTGAVAKQLVNVKDDASGLQYVTKLITQLAEPTAAEETKGVRVKADGSGFEYGPSLVQVQVTAGITADSTATAIPYDNTIPQITEGKEYATVTITPKKAGNYLRIRFNCFVGNSGANRTIVGLWADAGTDAIIALSSPSLTATDVAPINIDYTTTAPSTVATTFRIRFGPSAGTGYINQSGTTTLFSTAALKSNLIVEEIEPS